MQLDAAGARVPAPRPVAVAPGDALGAALAVGGAGLLCDLGLTASASTATASRKKSRSPPAACLRSNSNKFTLSLTTVVLLHVTDSCVKDGAVVSYVHLCDTTCWDATLIARLARLNYRFVRVDAADILRLLEANGYITDEATRALLATIEDPECSDESAVSVTAGLISELARRGLPPQRETMLVTVLLGYLHRWRQASTALEDCAIEIGVQLQSTPQVRERIRALVLDYIQVVRG